MKKTGFFCSAAVMAAAMIISFSVIPARNRVLADRISPLGRIEIDRRDASSDSMHVYYVVNNKGYGSKNGWKNKGQMVESVSGNRIENISMKLSGSQYSGGIKYAAYVQGSSKWKSWASNGKLAGTQNLGLRLEAIKIKLTGEVANHYDVFYRTRTQTYGWLNWAKNGEISGTVGYSKKMSAIQVVLVPKNSGLPGDVAGVASQQPKAAVIKESASSPSAEFKADVGPSYPLRYENEAVYCYDPATKEKISGWIRINGLTYYFDPSKDGKLTDFSVNDIFSKSLFIGNSTSEGLVSYFNSKGKDYLGGPSVAAKVSYTFNSDKSKLSGYMLTHNGNEYQAKALVKKLGSKYAFIMMGTNDLMGTSASSVAKKYKTYIEGIQKENPGVVIFIQSTTPRRGTSQLKNLTNEKIDELNKQMKKYADSKPEVFYIDISTALKDSDGNMKSSYSSDGYVHLNKKGYKTWVNTVVDYIRTHYIELAAANARAASAEGAET